MKKVENFKVISGQMKNLVRRGWVCRQVQSPEVDASHSWGVSMLVQLYAPKELDLLKCLKMANIHDLAEVYAVILLLVQVFVRKKNMTWKAKQ